jgi:amino acid transporter
MKPKVARKKLGFWPQVALIFFTVSGGAYGLEAMVGAVGTKWTLLLTLLVPLFWATPIALMAAELSSSIPEEGGYYIWVRRGLGRFWGFQEGWWTLCYSMVDLAVYPVLFVNYMSFFFPQLNLPDPYWQVVRWSVCFLFIAFSLIINLRGSRAVGMSAVANLLIVSFPFIILTIMGIFRGSWSQLGEAIHQGPPDGMTFAKIAGGLAIVLWNYCGWDNTSTYAEEVENPQRNYPRTLGIAMVIIILSYVFPLLAGFKATVVAADWGETAGWPTIAEKLGGHWLGVLGAAAALLSVWSLFNSQLLYVCHVPGAMARDGWLPKMFGRADGGNGTPVTTLLFLAVASALFSALSLNKLMVVDILFYTLGLSLEFAALIALRKSEPDLKRPFRIPLGRVGLVLMAIPALAVAIVVAVFSTMGTTGSYLQLSIVACGILLGVVVYSRREKARVRNLAQTIPDLAS